VFEAPALYDTAPVVPLWGFIPPEEVNLSQLLVEATGCVVPWEPEEWIPGAPVQEK